MKNIDINADIGEGRPGNSIDLQLMEHVDTANIALGAHAGDPAWSRDLAARAAELKKSVSLHPGYPDREGFGRRKMDIPFDTLRVSLDRQRAVLPNVDSCKFHGAIYNEATIDRAFAADLIGWCVDQGIVQVIAPDASCLAIAAMAAGIKVVREAFVDRRYTHDGDRLVLVGRSDPNALITEIKDAIDQANDIVNKGCVALINGDERVIRCDTLCLHGDSDLAIELAQALRQWKIQ